MTMGKETTPKEMTKSNEEVVNTDTAGESKSHKYILLGSSVGIFVIIVALFGLIYIFSVNSKEKVQSEVVVLDQRSRDERIIDETINDLEEELNSIDASEDFDEFEDGEFAVAASEEELDSAIDDIDSMLEDLEQLEEGLEDFNEDDF